MTKEKKVGMRDEPEFLSLDEYRAMDRRDWQMMGNEDLGRNIRGYRSRILDEAVSDDQMIPKPGQISFGSPVPKSMTAAYRKILNNPETYHPMGKASHDVGIDMSKQLFIKPGDRTMCANLSALIKERNKMAVRGVEKTAVGGDSR
jgi:hypothetical protein